MTGLIGRCASALGLGGVMVATIASPSLAQVGWGASAYGYGPSYGPEYYAYAPPQYGHDMYGNYMRGAYANQIGPAGGCWIATDSQRGYGYWGQCKSTRRDLGRAAITGQAGRSTRLVPPTR